MFFASFDPSATKFLGLLFPIRKSCIGQPAAFHAFSIRSCPILLFTPNATARASPRLSFTICDSKELVNRDCVITVTMRGLV